LTIIKKTTCLLPIANDRLCSLFKNFIKPIKIETLLACIKQSQGWIYTCNLMINRSSKLLADHSRWKKKKCFGYLMSSKNAFTALLRSIAQNGILNIFRIIEDVFKFEHFLIMWDIITTNFKQIWFWRNWENAVLLARC
jgi:hypothetical protein